MAAVTYSNPIIPGFSPDPSIVYAEGVFFLVNSSFHVFPGLPVYASTNLKDWTHIGNAIHRPSQLNLAESTVLESVLPTGKTLVGVLGLSAPTIRYHAGRFYIICTNVWVEEEKLRIQNFYLTTTDIWSGQWSEPYFYGWPGIDPSIFIDDDGQAYIQGHWLLDRDVQPSSTIKQAAIDLSTGTLLTEIKEIWQGYAKFDSEGPHLYKKDGYYYLLLAEGGTFEHHLMSMSRSKNIWGPYESAPENPILTADGKDEFIQNTGHGDLVQDGNGSWWAVLHGVRSNRTERFPLSRETLLTPVWWPEGEFPRFAQPKMEMEVPEPRPTLTLPPLVPPKVQTEYPEILFIRNVVLDNYQYTKDSNGYQVSMIPSVSELSSRSGTVSFLGVRQRALTSTACTTLPLNQGTGIAGGYKAGLAVYKDDFRHSEIYFDSSTSKVCLNIMNRPFSANKKVEHAVANIEGCVQLEFELRASDLTYEFWYRASETPGQGEWKKAGEIDTLEISARDYTGPLFGVFAYGQCENKATGWINFKDFRITNLKK